MASRINIKVLLSERLQSIFGYVNFFRFEIQKKYQHTVYEENVFGFRAFTPTIKK